ncbi:hypothetical protein ACLB1E_30645 [Escherichia coli]
MQVSSLQLLDHLRFRHDRHIWWLAIVGFAGMIITWIVKSFDEDVDYYVPVAEIEKWKTSISMRLLRQG